MVGATGVDTLVLLQRTKVKVVHIRLECGLSLGIEGRGEQRSRVSYRPDTRYPIMYFTVTPSLTSPVTRVDELEGLHLWCRVSSIT